MGTLSFTIELSNADHVEAAKKFLDALTTSEAPKKEAPKKEAPKKEAPKKEAPKKEAPKKEAPKKEAPKKEAPKKEAPKKEEPSVNRSDIREILKVKAKDHRAEIKSKLTEVGATSVTSLSEDKFEEFYNFLNNL